MPPIKKQDFVSLKRATKKDVSRIVEIDKQAFKNEAWSKEIYLEILTRKSYPIYKVLYNNEIVGFLVYHKLDCAILNLAIDKSYRGKGFGTFLLNNLFKKFSKEVITLQVKTKNKRAIKLYTNLGFKTSRLIKKMYSNGDDGLIMQRIP